MVLYIEKNQSLRVRVILDKIFIYTIPITNIVIIYHKKKSRLKKIIVTSKSYTFCKIIRLKQVKKNYWDKQVLYIL